jgi:hypothetical protein
VPLAAFNACKCCWNGIPPRRSVVDRFCGSVVVEIDTDLLIWHDHQTDSVSISTTKERTAKSVDHRSTGGNSVPAAFACVKSGRGHVAPVYSREISKIFPVKFQISDLCKICRPQIYGGEFRSRSICMR